MVRALSAVVALAAAALGFASPATAGEAEYLKLREQYVYLTADQLLTEGYRVCQATNSGMRSSDIVQMVYRKLGHSGASVSTANDIVATAIIELDC